MLELQSLRRSSEQQCDSQRVSTCSTGRICILYILRERGFMRLHMPLFSLLFVAIFTYPTLGNDVPYGADGLPYLYRNAALIVQATKAVAIQGDASLPTRALVFDVELGTVLKGKTDQKSVLVPLTV